MKTLLLEILLLCLPGFDDGNDTVCRKNMNGRGCTWCAGKVRMLLYAHVVQEKYEWWWMYMCDAKKKQLLAGPMQICTLGDRDEVFSRHQTTNLIWFIVLFAN